MVTRRVAAIAIVVGSLMIASPAALWLGARHGDGRSAVAAREPAHIIDPIPSPAFRPAPTPTPVSHEGLRIRMPEVGIDLPIVEGNGFDAPLYMAAHYAGTTWPGEGGRSVIYAHARVGMFGPLFGAHPNQEIQIASPDGSVRRYVVSEYYPRWPITDLRWLRPGDHEEIVLITCTTYNYNDPRIIVVGEPR